MIWPTKQQLFQEQAYKRAQEGQTLDIVREEQRVVPINETLEKIEVEGGQDIVNEFLTRVGLEGDNDSKIGDLTQQFDFKNDYDRSNLEKHIRDEISRRRILIFLVHLIYGRETEVSILWQMQPEVIFSH